MSPSDDYFRYHQWTGGYCGIIDSSIDNRVTRSIVSVAFRTPGHDKTLGPRESLHAKSPERLNSIRPNAFPFTVGNLVWNLACTADRLALALTTRPRIAPALPMTPSCRRSCRLASCPIVRSSDSNSARSRCQEAVSGCSACTARRNRAPGRDAAAGRATVRRPCHWVEVTKEATRDSVTASPQRRLRSL